ncbi:hypothetical protein ARAM_005356 [Aspergillus rambellii]|uniref:Protein kinase domain-containing protein n=2 Tax=Aspergillus subgen. Nidulantes TaxID=2720870 RepID=A0A0F8WC63_9EURO|nr:hypothetical protein ARAM_005356 [Aspergillus rambellii]KKK20895.1 hypothetical protein AOCH_004074 [Aspergillus ochraceoroseus]
MADFIRSEILGTTFEATSRHILPVCEFAPGMRICNQELTKVFITSSAYDLIVEQPVAIKKMMKPFDSASIAKRAYREVKLLKQLRHDNVWIPTITSPYPKIHGRS